jgi:hypothetical protein
VKRHRLEFVVGDDRVGRAARGAAGVPIAIGANRYAAC